MIDFDGHILPFHNSAEFPDTSRPLRANRIVGVRIVPAGEGLCAAGHSNMDEQRSGEIVRGLREGRRDAWEALYDAHAGRVWRGVARLLGPHSADVADVVQEAMLAAARSARTYDPAKGSLWNWLWGIARMQVLLHHRKRGRHDRWKHAGMLADWMDKAEATPCGLLETAELRAMVRETLTELDGPCEALLTARYLDGDSVARMAVREKTTETAIRSRLARAREAFRRAFARLTNENVHPEEVTNELP